MFAFEHSGIVPDIVTMSKALGGRDSHSAIAFREELNTLPREEHRHLQGNMVAFAAGAARLEWMIENRVPSTPPSWEKRWPASGDGEGSRILGEARGSAS